jgi:hypothetical protein
MHRACLTFVFLILLGPALTFAQDSGSAPPAPQEPERNNPDVRVDPLQPDFNLAALPTTLRMPAGKWAFRVTHRFNRNLGRGDFGDLASDLFGLDGGGQIGLEVRMGLRNGTQVGIHRTSDRAIQLFVQQNIFDQRSGDAFGLDAIATFEGDDNLSEHRQGALGAALSKAVANRATLYVEPLVVLNANRNDTGDDHTLMLGLGGRLRVSRSMYVLAEYTPRLAGYDADADQITVGVESRAGGHLFQINVGNGLGTTFGQLARGGVDYDQWFLGFNISRKFF